MSDHELNQALRRLSRANHIDLNRPPPPTPPALPPTPVRGVVGGPLRPETFGDVLRRIRGINRR